MDEIYIYLIIIMELDEWLETSTRSGAGPSFIEKKTKKEVRAPKFWWLGTRTLVPQMFLTDHPLDCGGGHFCSIWFEKIMVGDRH